MCCSERTVSRQWAPAAAPDELRKEADEIIDASLMAVMPGMVNAHTHLFQTFIRGLADDKPLLEWLKAAIWPVASCLTEEDAYLAAMLGLVENIRGGATSVIDHQYIHTEPGNDDGVFRAAEETGVRFLNARGWADMNYHPALQETPDRIMGEMARLHERWHGAGGRPSAARVRPADPLGLLGCDDAAHPRPGGGVGRGHAHPRGRNARRDRHGARVARNAPRRVAGLDRRAWGPTCSWSTASG